jgi:hypothetical protein
VGAERAYDTLQQRRRGRRELTDEQKARREEQLRATPKGSAETTSEDAAEFLGATRTPRDRSRGEHETQRRDRRSELLKMLD